MPTGNTLPCFALTREAPAKINLALHVTGQRPDGYHLIESLVTFAGAGTGTCDRLGLSPSDADRFTVSGRFSVGLPEDNDPKSGNLVLRARDLLRQALETEGKTAGPVHIHLEKNLPIASGIGGGSADAAAALIGLNELWHGGVSTGALRVLGLVLGADLPMCLTGRPLLAGGIGEDIGMLADFPPLSMVLVNPLVHVSTPAIFRALLSKTNPPLALPAGTPDAAGWIMALSGMRNDLEPPARNQAPEISLVSEALIRHGASLVRMSGSGATCFGIFASLAEAQAAADGLATQHPGWYVAATRTAGGQA